MSGADANNSFLYTFDDDQLELLEEPHHDREKAPSASEGRPTDATTATTTTTATFDEKGEKLEEPELLYMPMLTGDLAGDAKAAEAAVSEAKSQARLAAAALQRAEAGVAAAESRLKAGVHAAAQEAAHAANALYEAVGGLRLF